MCIINKLQIECSKATAPQVFVISYGTCDTHGPNLDACEFINIRDFVLEMPNYLSFFA